MEIKKYNDIVGFLESKDSKQRIWPRNVVGSKDGKDAKRAYRQKCEGVVNEDGLLFKKKKRRNRKRADVCTGGRKVSSYLFY